MITIRELADNIKQEKSIAIFIHIRPDGDAIGSSVGLKFLLDGLGIDSDIYSTDPVPRSFMFLKGVENIKFELNKTKKYSAYLAIDCADIARLGVFADDFQGFNGNKYVIDHHISNTRFGTINYVIDKAANAENIVDLAIIFGVPVIAEMAQALLTGITTDTGGFRHKNVTVDTFRAAAFLMEKGADNNKIFYYCFSRQTQNRAKLFGLTMEKIRYFADGKIALISIHKKMLEDTGSLPEETEGFIDFITGIEGVEISISVMETEKDTYKISLRSRNADVNAVAQVFGGGGHTLASGCKIVGEYEEVVDRITSTAKRFLPD